MFEFVYLLNKLERVFNYSSSNSSWM